MIMQFEKGRARVGIDYGPRIIGLAHSDLFGLVHPYGTIRNNGNLTYISYEILNFAYTNGASELIVGIPLDFDGIMSYAVKNFNGRLCLNFSTVLSSIATKERGEKLKTLLFDERYTTQEAKTRIKAFKTKASIDAMSATCLLERYIEDSGSGSILAKPCIFPPPLEIASFDYNTVKEHIRSLHWSEPLAQNSNNAVKVSSVNKPQLEVKEANEICGNQPISTEQSSTIIDTKDELEKDEMAEYYLIRSQRRKKGTLRVKNQNTFNSISSDE